MTSAVFLRTPIIFYFIYSTMVKLFCLYSLLNVGNTTDPNRNGVSLLSTQSFKSTGRGKIVGISNRMSIFRKSPLFDYLEDSGCNEFFTFGANSITGWRKTQMDRYVCLKDFYEDYSFFAVYDGHGDSGHLYSEYLKRHLHEHIFDAFKEYEDKQLAIYIGFLRCEMQIREISKKELQNYAKGDLWELPLATPADDPPAMENPGTSGQTEVSDSASIVNEEDLCELPLTTGPDSLNPPAGDPPALENPGTSGQTEVSDSASIRKKGDLCEFPSTSSPESHNPPAGDPPTLGNSGQTEVSDSASIMNNGDLCELPLTTGPKTHNPPAGDPPTLENPGTSGQTEVSDSASIMNNGDTCELPLTTGPKTHNPPAGDPPTLENLGTSGQTEVSDSASIMNNGDTCELPLTTGPKTHNPPAGDPPTLENLGTSGQTEVSDSASIMNNGNSVSLVESPYESPPESHTSSAQGSGGLNNPDSSMSKKTYARIAHHCNRFFDENPQIMKAIIGCSETFQNLLKVNLDNENDTSDEDYTDAEKMEYDESSNFSSENNNEDNIDMESMDDISGSTATVVILNKKKIFIANVGDSRCVASINGKAVELSVDHKPDHPEEKLRIKKGGHLVNDGRIDYTLDLSRAFGDFCFKQNSTDEAFQAVSCEPDIKEIDVTKDINFIILATDGIWNIWNDQHIINFMNVRRWLPLESGFKELFETIVPSVEEGLSNPYGYDNMSAVMILLKPSAQDEITDKDANLAILPTTRPKQVGFEAPKSPSEIVTASQSVIPESSQRKHGEIGKILYRRSRNRIDVYQKSSSYRQKGGPQSSAKLPADRYNQCSSSLYSGSSSIRDASSEMLDKSFHYTKVYKTSPAPRLLEDSKSSTIFPADMSTSTSSKDSSSLDSGSPRSEIMSIRSPLPEMIIDSDSSLPDENLQPAPSRSQSPAIRVINLVEPEVINLASRSPSPIP